jgi:flagellum-specific peptidoglycan hydrolase FlgJ
VAKQQDFIKRFTPIAKEVGAKYGIPWGFLIAEAAEESAWGTSEVCIKANNYFGTKEAHADAAFNQRGTLYAKFTSPDESFKYQGWQLSVPRYAGGKAHKNDFKKYGDFLQNAGYCQKASPGEDTYGDKIAEIAEQWSLNLDETETAKLEVETLKIMRPYGNKDSYWSGQSSRTETAVIVYRILEYLRSVNNV